MTRSMQHIQDELLVLECQSGRTEAFATLMRRWLNVWQEYARRLLRNDADAADAVQEAMIAISRSISRLDDPAMFAPWSRRILANKCADAIRRHQQQRRLAATSAAAAVASSTVQAPAVEPQVEQAQLRMAIDQLSLDQQALLHLRYGRDMGTHDIARVLHLREGTVKSRLHHARNQLKSILERNTNDDQL